MHVRVACKLTKVCIKYKLNLQTYSILLHAIWFFWISSLLLVATYACLSLFSSLFWGSFFHILFHYFFLLPCFWKKKFKSDCVYSTRFSFRYCSKTVSLCLSTQSWYKQETIVTCPGLHWIRRDNSTAFYAMFVRGFSLSLLSFLVQWLAGRMAWKQTMVEIVSCVFVYFEH